jgi:hypothetical protein
MSKIKCGVKNNLRQKDIYVFKTKKAGNPFEYGVN